MGFMRNRRFDLGAKLMLKQALLNLFLLGALVGCSNPEQESNVMIKMGPGQPADVVYLFKEGTTWEQILDFQRTVTGIPDENGTGYAALPGEMSGVAVRVRGHDAEAIRFKPNATIEEKTLYKGRLAASPLIYAVYENVIPSRITASSIPTHKSY